MKPRSNEFISILAGIAGLVFGFLALFPQGKRIKRLVVGRDRWARRFALWRARRSRPTLLTVLPFRALYLIMSPAVVIFLIFGAFALVPGVATAKQFKPGATVLRSSPGLAGSSRGMRSSGAVTQDDITVDIDPILPGESSHGYIEYPLVITNSSSDRTHQVDLLMPEHDNHAHYSYYSTSWLSDITRSVMVPPGATLRIPIWQPTLPIMGSDLSVVVDGVKLRESRAVNPLRRDDYYFRTDYSSILLSLALARDPLPFMTKKATGYTPAEPAVGADIPVSAWSANRLAYSRYDGIAMTADEFNAAGVDVIAALMEYAECGGVLIILGALETPARWKKLASNSESAGVVSLYPGFGTVFRISEASPTAVATDDWGCCEMLIQNTRKVWNFEHEYNLNERFPIVDKIGIPIRGLFFLVFCYAIIIGPLNIYVLTRMKKRIYLLWTVPLLSFITCTAVLVYAMVEEGWESRVRADVVTWLDESAHRAVTIGWTAFYTPLTSADGFHFGYETELTPLGAHRYNSAGIGPRSLDWSRDQHLGSNWVMARLPVWFSVRKSETRRERLALRKAPDGSLSVVNGLGAPITNLWLEDSGRRYFTGGSIPAGAEGRLSQTSGPTNDAPASEMHDVFSSAWSGAAQTVFSSAIARLRAGTYIARLDGTPFLENGLADIGKNERVTVVYGILSGSERED
ncbi:MAG: hypothetical protein HQM09_21315 [Candidatus Riflebacteria bacterium]|nr:hypothetical protein [Candidatus Riflebacteria bacterium]